MKIGIDLGNTVARAAYLNEQGIPEIVPDFDDPNVQVTPALVHIGQRGCLVGTAVENLLEIEPDLPVARNFRRPFESNPSAYTDENGRQYKAVHLTTLLLRKLVQDAEKAASELVDGAVIAVPKWFGEEDRKMISEAGSIAGISTIELIDEAEAIAQHYNVGQSKRKKNYLVFDLGSSSFTATIISAGSGKTKIEGSVHTPKGADQIDAGILEMARHNFRFAHGFDPVNDPVAMVQLQHFSSEIKKELSAPGVDSVRKCILLSGKPLDFYLDRRQLSNLLKPLLDETVEAISQALQETTIEWENIDQILMSGGNCLLSSICEDLQSAIGLDRKRIRCQQPDFAEAFGAAHLTRDLTTTKPDTQKGSLKVSAAAQVLGQDLVVSSLVPGTREEFSHVIIKKDSPLPARREIRCMTAKAGQTDLCFQWNLRSDHDQAIKLGETRFGNLPEETRSYPVELVVTAQLNGIIDVSITDPELERKEDFVLEHRERKERTEREHLRTRLQELPINHP